MARLKLIVKRKLRVCYLYDKFGEQYFYRCGRRPSRFERTVLSQLKRKEEADKERRKYIRNPDPGSPITLDNPVNPLYEEGRNARERANEIAAVSSTRGLGGVFRLKPIDGLARGVLKKGIKRIGTDVQRVPE